MWQLSSVQILHYLRCLGAENRQNLPIRKHYIRRQDVGASVTNFLGSILGVRAPQTPGYSRGIPGALFNAAHARRRACPCARRRTHAHNLDNPAHPRPPAPALPTAAALLHPCFAHKPHSAHMCLPFSDPAHCLRPPLRAATRK